MDTTDPDATAPPPGTAAPTGTEASPAPGARIGRYLSLDTLGRGGGGEVFAAFDPVLDRKVAIKLLHGTEEAKPALIREGRMLAKVVHPAVVEVYEVGFHEGQAFMAMELVGGGDLQDFANEQRELADTGAIIDALLQVADGLAAAHAAGVVHGDIKPSNVLRSEAGPFKVSDFGIARMQSGELTEGFNKPVGTPAFMAPEQHAGALADERTDQYSFCVTAWVALTGVLPYSQGSVSRSTKDASLSATGPLDDLETLKQEGPPPWPPEHRVDGNVVDALRRGLSAEPDARWPTMAALVAELRPNLGRARLRRAGVGVGLVAAAGLGVVGVQTYQHQRAVEGCEDAGAEIRQAWNADTSPQLRATLESSERSYAKATVDRVLPRMEAWADEWASTRTAGCTKHLVDGTWDDDLSARAAWCLEEQRIGFTGAVERLTVSAKSVDGAVALATSLRSPKECADVGSLMRRPLPPSDEERETRIAALRELATARALDRTGDRAEGLEAIDRVKALLGPESESPMLARAFEAEGKLRSHAGEYAASEAASSRAYSLAAGQEDWSTAAWAAESLIFVVGIQLDRPVEGVAWETHARVAADLSGDPFRLHETSRTANLAAVRRAMGAYDEAIALHEQTLELLSESLGTDHPLRATTLGNLAAVYMNTGEAKRALELFEEAAELRKKSLGPDHPSTLSSLANLAGGLAKTGQLDRAKEGSLDVLARRERALGPSHPDVATTLDNVGAIHNLLAEFELGAKALTRSLEIRRAVAPGTLAEAQTLSHLATSKSSLGDSKAAVELLEQCLAIRERVNGPDHAKVGEALINLGTEHFILEDLERAEQMFARAKDIYANALGTSHPGYGAAVNNLGDVALEAERYPDAIELYEQAHAIWAKSLGPKHPHTATAQSRVGTAWLAMGDAKKARPFLEQSIAAFEAGQGVQEQEAQTRFELAKALHELGDTRAAADSANAARAVLDKLGGGRSLRTAEVDAWLAANALAE